MAFQKLHYPVFQQLADKFKIVAISDVDLHKRDYWITKLGLNRSDGYEDYRKMLERNDIDVFDIVVPIELNYEISETVARSIAGTGKGIICEKPSADNMENALAHQELSSRYKVSIMIAEHTRYSDEINIIRDAVINHRIGKIFYFMYNSVRNFPRELFGDTYSSREWRQYPRFPGGAFLDAGGFIMWP